MRYVGAKSLTDREWQKYLLGIKDREVQDAAEVVSEHDVDFSEHPEFQAWQCFSETGDINAYLDKMQDLRMNPNWGNVSRINPHRSIDNYLNNISIFWDWLLEDPQSRIDSLHLYKHADNPINEYFWSAFRFLPEGATQDPAVNFPLFDMIFGKSFKEYNQFPIALGKEKWRPSIKLEPLETFVKASSQIDNYLFGEIISRGSPAMLPNLDYWASMIPLIKREWVVESGAFLLSRNVDEYLDGKMNEKDASQFELQDLTRRFLASLLGYHAGYDFNENFDHHDPEIETKVQQILDSFEWPEEYSRMIDFIHRHKEESLNVSEPDDTV